MQYNMRRRGPWWLTEETLREMEEGMQQAGWPVGWGQRRQARAWAPVTDMYDKGDRIVVKAELPGVSLEAIDISLEKGVLTIQGEREQEEVADESWYCCERRTGKFYRAIQVPADIDAASVSAAYQDGILAITLPKVQEEQTRKIAVKSG